MDPWGCDNIEVYGIRYLLYSIRFGLHHRPDFAPSTIHHLNVVWGRRANRIANILICDQSLTVVLTNHILLWESCYIPSFHIHYVMCLLPMAWEGLYKLAESKTIDPTLHNPVNVISEIQDLKGPHFWVDRNIGSTKKGHGVTHRPIFKWSWSQQLTCDCVLQRIIYYFGTNLISFMKYIVQHIKTTITITDL